MKTQSLYETLYNLVASIPPGRVATYGQLALLAGMPRGARVVGTALRRAPKRRNLPCHRVVNRLGELAPEGVFGSRQFQRLLLQEEGVTFLPNGRIDLAAHIWRPHEHSPRP